MENSRLVLLATDVHGGKAVSYAREACLPLPDPGVTAGRAAQLRPGRSARFATVLIPHAPTDDATSLAAGVKPLLDTHDAAVIELTGADGERLLAGFNDSGKVIKAGPVETDAHLSPPARSRIACWSRSARGSLSVWGPLRSSRPL